MVWRFRPDLMGDLPDLWPLLLRERLDTGP
jgi:hypothetical protein